MLTFDEGDITLYNKKEKFKILLTKTIHPIKNSHQFGYTD